MTASRNRQLVPVAVLAAGLLAAGSAYAASRLHGSPSSSSGTGEPRSGTPISSGSTAASHGGPDGEHHRRGRDELAAAASYLGLPESDLLASLQSGKTLAQIADATSGKSAAGLIDALVAPAKAELDTAVTAGRITQAQRDRMVTTLKTRFTALVNGTRPAHDGLRPGYRVAPGYGAAPGSGTHI